MGLIVDTGIVLDILARYPAGTLHDAMFKWAAEVAGRVEPPPHGRSITMLISAGTYRDYKARIGQAGIATPRSYWHSLRKIKIRRAISRPRQLYFTMQPVRTDDADAARWQGDRFDRPFFALLVTASRGIAWSDLQIIFASRDRDAISRMRDMAAMLSCDGRRLHFADSLSSCEEMIIC